MKMTRMLGILGSAVVLVAAATAVDVRAQVEFEVAPFGGGTFFLTDPPNQFRLGAGPGTNLILEGASFDNAWTLGVNAGFRFNDMWAIEGMFSWLPTKVVATSGIMGSEDVNGYMYGVTGLFYVPTRVPFKPFFGLGIGGETFDYQIPGIENDTEFMSNVVGGLYFDVNSTWGVRLEARDCIARFRSHVQGVKSGWENDLMTTVGLSYRIPIG